MPELLATGGCWNAGRIALDGAGAGARNWQAAIETNVVLTDAQIAIFAHCVDSDDMDDATDATFKLQWRNVSDAGSWNDLAATGEIKWATVSDLVDGNAVVVAEDSGGNSVNCSTKGWSHTDGIEKEGANGFTRTIFEDEFQDFHWALDLSDADAINADEYEFRLTESGGTVIGTSLATLTVVVAGKIDGTTKNNDRTSAVVSVQVTAYLSDEASPPKPVGAHVAQLVSSGADGTFSLLGLVSGSKYFLHFFKDDTADLSDGSIEITAVDA